MTSLGNLGSMEQGKAPLSTTTATMAGDNGSQPAGGVAGSIGNILADSAHPTALIFFLLFRTLAVLDYLFGTFAFDSEIFIFVTTVLLLAVDFWTVKNVSGRLLVGLRWWSQARPDGSTTWLFESRPEGHRACNPTDSRIFWAALYGFPILWLFFGLIRLFRFSLFWLLVSLIALALNIVNITGYVKCDRDATAKKGGKTAAGNIASLGQLGSGGTGGILGSLLASRLFSLF